VVVELFMKLFVATKAVLMNSNGRVLIVRESGAYDEGTNEGKWDVVGGRIDVNESLLEGLKREVKEESGLEIEVDRVLSANDKFQIIKGEEVHIVRIFYLCRAKEGKVELSEDHDRFEWIDSRNCGEFGILEEVKEVLNLI
jgi:8-oxo-dGTP diphosphatase